MSIAFDTLQMAERLEKAGVPAEQAKVHIAILADLVKAKANRAAHPVTAASEAKRLCTEIIAYQKTLEAKIDQSKAEIKAGVIRWVVSVGIIQMALIAGLILTFIPAH